MSQSFPNIGPCHMSQGPCGLATVTEQEESNFVRKTSPGSTTSLSSSATLRTACEALDVASSQQQAEEVKKKWGAQDPGRYVLVVGTVLAACAGFVNVTALMTCGSFVSHVTGTTARLGMAIEGHYTEDMPSNRMFQAGLLIASFLLGAVLCGLLVSRNEVHFGKSAYGVALVLNCLMLLSAIAVVDVDTPDSWPSYYESKWLALYLMAAACGLQNGMCTAHFGAVVRTTHLTGLMTDSGLTIGRLMSILLTARCNKKKFRPLDWAEIAVDLKKLLVFFCLLSGYISGVGGGCHLAERLGINALFIPAFITGSGGLTYTFAKARCWAMFERVEAEKLAHDLEAAEEIFTRARSQIEVYRSDTPSPTHLDLEVIDDEVGKALSLLHDMEACLREKLTKTNSLKDGRSVGSPDAARRIVSAPSLPVADLKKDGLDLQKSSSTGKLQEAAYSNVRSLYADV